MSRFDFGGQYRRLGFEIKMSGCHVYTQHNGMAVSTINDCNTRIRMAFPFLALLDLSRTMRTDDDPWMGRIAFGAVFFRAVVTCNAVPAEEFTCDRLLHLATRLNCQLKLVQDACKTDLSHQQRRVRYLHHQMQQLSMLSINATMEHRKSSRRRLTSGTDAILHFLISAMILSLFCPTLVDSAH